MSLNVHSVRTCYHASYHARHWIMGHHTPLKLISSTPILFSLKKKKQGSFLETAFCAVKGPRSYIFFKKEEWILRTICKPHLIDSLISANKNILVERILKRQWGRHSFTSKWIFWEIAREKIPLCDLEQQEVTNIVKIRSLCPSRWLQ